MDTRSGKQQRAEAIAQALTTRETMDDADDDHAIESLAQRFEARATQSGLDDRNRGEHA